MTKVKLGIIGAGKISDIHLKTFSKNKNVSLVSITDVNIALATEKAEKYGIQKVENSYLDVISDPGVDVVDILLPHYLHAKVSLKAIRKGKAIICEKPFVIKLEDAKKLIRETKKNKISMHLKHYLHYSLSHLKIKKMIQDGLIGKPYLVKCLYTCNSVNGMIQVCFIRYLFPIFPDLSRYAFTWSVFYLTIILVHETFHIVTPYFGHLSLLEQVS